ncbi:FUSC family protein [Gallicola sp. Sow4_E12]|uniref:FUSC family protein n=1 Tax=Gallicola sp. Sow4_E12 TaxID=3438785 RepID=UPI003F8FC0AD
MKFSFMKDVESIPFKIGLRTTKTVIAVFLCFAIDAFRTGGVPFYAAIAAVLCIQKDMENSWKFAKNREIATIIGGLWGMFYLFIENTFLSIDPEIIRELIISLMLIPIIHFSVWIKQKNATYLMCVVFLSVTITHGDDVSPFWFAGNRILDTSIGIGVALIVNYIPFEKLRKLRDSHK